MHSSCLLRLILASAFTTTACGDVVLVGTHPDASSQPTEVGRTLHTLEFAGDNLLIGYGDYGADTGPITIRHFDTNTDLFSDSLGIADTEAIFHINAVGNRAYALTTDPLLQGPGGYLSGEVQSISPWTATETLAGVHFYGITPFGGNDQHLFLAGSGGPTARTNAMVYESVDGGATWTVSLDLARPDGVPGLSFLRIYGIAELDGSLYVQPMGLGTSKTPLDVHVYDGSSWRTQPTPTTTDGLTAEFFDTEEFQGQLILRNDHSGFRLSPTLMFDGDVLEEIEIEGEFGKLSFWDHYATDDTLYLLTNENTVVASQDLSSWMTVAQQLPENTRSLAVVDDDLYVGTSGSTLFRSQLSNVPEPSSGLQTLFALLLIAFINRQNVNRVSATRHP